jgi:hypothetical protein
MKWKAATRVALIALLAALAMNALLGIIIVLKGDFGDIEGKLLGTTFALALFTVLAIPSTVQLGRGRFYALSGFGISVSVIAFTLAVSAIWSDGALEDVFLTKLMGTFGVMAFASSHTALLLLASASPKVIKVTLIATITMLVVIAAALITSVWAEDLPKELARPLTVFAILDVLGSMAVPMLSKLNRLSAS